MKAVAKNIAMVLIVLGAAFVGTSVGLLIGNEQGDQQGFREGFQEGHELALIEAEAAGKTANTLQEELGLVKQALEMQKHILSQEREAKEKAEAVAARARAAYWLLSSKPGFKDLPPVVEKVSISEGALSVAKETGAEIVGAATGAPGKIKSMFVK